MKSDPCTPEDLLRRLANPAAAQPLGVVAAQHFLAQPVARFVNAKALPDHMDAILLSPLVDRVLGQHLEGFMERDRARAETRGDRLGDYMTPEAKAFLRKELGRPVILHRAFVDALVRQDAVKHLVGSIVEETVHRFVGSLKPGGPQGLFGNLPKGPGMGFVSKIAEQIESHIQRAAAAFVQGSLELLLGRLVQILSTPETAKQLGHLRLAGFEALCEVTVHAAWSFLFTLPVREALALLPGLLRHNSRRPELRQGLISEGEAILAEEGERSLAEALEDPTAALWQKEIIRQITPILEEFLASGPFQEWLIASG